MYRKSNNLKTNFQVFIAMKVMQITLRLQLRSAKIMNHDVVIIIACIPPVHTFRF